jgi:hypothetical protein
MAEVAEVVGSAHLAGRLRMVAVGAEGLGQSLAASVRLQGTAAQGLWEQVLQEPLPLVEVVVAAQRVALELEAKFAFGQSGDRHEKS